MGRALRLDQVRITIREAVFAMGLPLERYAAAIDEGRSAHALETSELVSRLAETNVDKAAALSEAFDENDRGVMVIGVLAPAFADDPDMPSPRPFADVVGS